MDRWMPMGLIMTGAVALATLSPTAQAQDAEDYQYWADRCREEIGTVGLEACEKAIALDDRDPALWLNQGVKYDRDLREPNRALVAYREAIQRDPDQNYALAWYNQCAVLLKLANDPRHNDAEILLPIFTELELITPETSDTERELFASDRTLLYQSVVKSCDRALNGDDNWGTASPARAWNNIGYAQDELGQYQDALAAYENALLQDPNHINALNNKGITLENLNRYPEALAAYDAALALDPNYERASRNRARLLQLQPDLETDPPEPDNADE
ncbi:tetratricopeptide repeat protein [Spirulina sp. CCNP1310]|uniref:tetratricopeptide repeat protein n=1 Tax=Spirulina sp. CCNP1310 TaxID=3110249 RepID=UPI002B1F2A8A|nr:tetratricopeptide repeat protein [Spirulina sp. CCNP1310]MEA5418301.1 tetratricopeptide repeat protein [Spirulina sp. CCNP1310]